VLNRLRLATEDRATREPSQTSRHNQVMSMSSRGAGDAGKGEEATTVVGGLKGSAGEDYAQANDAARQANDAARQANDAARQANDAARQALKRKYKGPPNGIKNGSKRPRKASKDTAGGENGRQALAGAPHDQRLLHGNTNLVTTRDENGGVTGCLSQQDKFVSRGNDLFRLAPAQARLSAVEGTPTSQQGGAVATPRRIDSGGPLSHPVSASPGCPNDANSPPVGNAESVSSPRHTGIQRFISGNARPATAGGPILPPITPSTTASGVNAGIHGSIMGKDPVSPPVTDSTASPNVNNVPQVAAAGHALPLPPQLLPRTPIAMTGPVGEIAAGGLLSPSAAASPTIDNTGSTNGTHLASTLVDLDAQLSHEISRMGLGVGQGDEATQEFKGGVTSRDAEITKLTSLLRDSEARVVEQQQRITALETALIRRYEQIGKLQSAATIRDRHIADLDTVIAVRDERISNLEHCVATHRALYNDMRALLNRHEPWQAKVVAKDPAA
jgi:hypothetical protein